ncbi:hypothetical protein DSM106972_030540 [Dulcicalothrix desertica PCC 7102]|uniref:Putative restriction endonuclease domain-containing protein n=1 Tax=Dulcicalothrix desertica PCC 7102 TaxID=232991 RepID=A0A3S1B8G4_9CYAN|nr:Uma2 family endonuclease [Dulcicalothrix desertica]RUT06797.1 hypothetical protein DSM106972_030540 [Dulcicalothrix desertica PCC 7102]TWH50093.1 Uma2 family endonuclease [Dulcicalothrix desertica PCC 7102]
MNTTVKQKLTFEQFLEQCLEEGLYELVDGEIVEMRPTRQHDDTADYTADSYQEEIKRLNLNYVVKTTTAIQTTTSYGVVQGRKPDVSVIDKTVWRSDGSNYNALDVPIQLAVEVTSTNWEDDYIDKLDDYQRLGILEYWIIDYLAIASRQYLGNPKVPTVFVYLLDENGKYQRAKYQGNDIIISRIFPELKLTVKEIWKA